MLITFVAGPALLDLLGISQPHLPLPHIQVIGASLQVVLLSVLNVFFYLDQRRTILLLVGQLLALNVIFTALTLWAGAVHFARAASQRQASTHISATPRLADQPSTSCA